MGDVVAEGHSLERRQLTDKKMRKRSSAAASYSQPGSVDTATLEMSSLSH